MTIAQFLPTSRFVVSTQLLLLLEFPFGTHRVRPFTSRTLRSAQVHSLTTKSHSFTCVPLATLALPLEVDPFELY